MLGKAICVPVMESLIRRVKETASIEWLTDEPYVGAVAAEEEGLAPETADTGNEQTVDIAAEREQVPMIMEEDGDSTDSESEENTPAAEGARDGSAYRWGTLG